MPNITNLTIPQILSANTGQLRAAMNSAVNAMTLRQMRVFLMDADKITDTPIITYRPDGQVQSFVEVERDMEKGVVTGKKTVTYTYYPTGEVDKITISLKDGLDKETFKKEIKHFKDGKAPIATVALSAIEGKEAVK